MNVNQWRNRLVRPTQVDLSLNRGTTIGLCGKGNIALSRVQVVGGKASSEGRHRYAHHAYGH